MVPKIGIGTPRQVSIHRRRVTWCLPKFNTAYLTHYWINFHVFALAYGQLCTTLYATSRLWHCYFEGRGLKSLGTPVLRNTFQKYFYFNTLSIFKSKYLHTFTQRDNWPKGENSFIVHPHSCHWKVGTSAVAKFNFIIYLSFIFLTPWSQAAEVKWQCTNNHPVSFATVYSTSVFKNAFFLCWTDNKKIGNK